MEVITNIKMILTSTLVSWQTGCTGVSKCVIGVLVTFSFLVYLSQLRESSSKIVAVSNFPLSTSQDVLKALNNFSQNPFGWALNRIMSGPGRPRDQGLLYQPLTTSVVPPGNFVGVDIVGPSVETTTALNNSSDKLHILLQKIANIKIEPFTQAIRSNFVAKSPGAYQTPGVPQLPLKEYRSWAWARWWEPTTAPERYAGIPPVQPDRYVTFSSGFADGRGLGNQLFNIASAVYVAVLSGRQFIMEKVNFTQRVDQVFDLSSVTRIDNLCPCTFFVERYSLSYDPRVEDIGQPGHYTKKRRTIQLVGYYQSWKYTRNIEKRLRDLFKFKPKVMAKAEKFLKDNFPPGWNNVFFRVAIHNRRGDYLTPKNEELGYSVPNATYFNRAMKYFLSNYGRVQFIVVSQDRMWTRKYIRAPSDMSNDEVNVTYSFGNSAGVDMAIMSLCQHVVMSGGSFGWWAGYFSKGTTVYYSGWPRPGSDLHRTFRRGDFYHPAWIPMDDNETIS